MYCGKCGAHQQDGNRFCGQCGADTSGSQKTSIDSTQSPIYSHATGFTSSQQHVPIRDGFDNRAKVAIAIFAVVVCLGAAGLSYLGRQLVVRGVSAYQVHHQSQANSSSSDNSAISDQEGTSQNPYASNSTYDPTKDFLGIEQQPVSDEAAQMIGAPYRHGLLLSIVIPGSRAAYSGLLQGDIVVKIDGQYSDILVNDLDGARYVHAYDRKIPCEIYRHGQFFNRTIIL